MNGNLHIVTPEAPTCPACQTVANNTRPDVAFLTALILIGQNRLESEIRHLCPHHLEALAVGAAACNEAGG